MSEEIIIREHDDHVCKKVLQIVEEIREDTKEILARLPVKKGFVLVFTPNQNKER